MKKSESSFTRLDAAADGLLRRMAGDQRSPVSRRAGAIVGEPLSRKIEPTGLAGRRLTVSLLDPSWKKAVVATLPSSRRSSPRDAGAFAPDHAERHSGKRR
jgi:hypothetical protein